MSEPVDIRLTTYSKTQFDKAINTEFTQFVTQSTAPPAPEDTLTIPQFFTAYQTLFLEIPKEGETDSHQYLANTSGEYAGGKDISAEVLALTEEVTELREENIELQRQVIRLASLNTASVINDLPKSTV